MMTMAQTRHVPHQSQIYYGAVPRQAMSYGERSNTRNAQSQNLQNKSRRLYVGNIPYHVGIGENGMVQLFSALYVAGFRPLASGEPLPVTSFWLHADGKFGFMELRGDSEAVDIMQLNGLVLHGRPLRINRPSDYRPEIHGAVTVAPSKINAAGINELCAQLGGILAPPAHLVVLADAQNAVSIVSNGVLSAVENVENPAILPNVQHSDVESQRATETGSSHVGNASPARTREEHQPIDHVSVEHQLTVSPSDISRHSLAAASHSGDRQESGRSIEQKSEGAQITAVVVSLRHLVSDEDLDGSQEDYEDLLEDVREECSTYGTVVGISIPRLGPGRGTAFISYSAEDDANRAIENLRQRVFNGKTIEALVVPGVMSTEEAVEKCS